ncbi:MAG: cadherin repeat domain-containing protein [Phycisphaerales bacterium]|nr:cadherin repeat domain-containing protein [Phycisphaerales bacterium]
MNYALLTGPVGMTLIDTDGDGRQDTLVWSPTIADVGTHSIRLRVTDDFGMFDPAEDQTFSLRVATNVPNRPPMFVTNPVTVAYAGELYTYAARAFDPDGDSLTYSVVQGPGSDFTIDPNTGDVTWIPSPNLIDVFVNITLIVDDGNVGIDNHTYSLQIVNRPPLIITKAPERFIPLFINSRTPTVELYATIRDFIPGDGITPSSHIDFEPTGRRGLYEDLVHTTIGSDRKPVYAGPFENNQSIYSSESFYAWYHDIDGYDNRTTVPLTFRYDYNNGVYKYESDNFFRLMASCMEITNGGHITSILHLRCIRSLRINLGKLLNLAETMMYGYSSTINWRSI